MIFVTVGMRLPFDRLIRAMDAWAAVHPAEEVLGQVLYRTPDCVADIYRPSYFEYHSEMEPDAFNAACARAQGIVGHAGTGTLITAMTHGKPLVMMPRRADLREHRNDHQLATVRHFRTLPGVMVVETESELSEALDAIIAGTARSVEAAAKAEFGLIKAIRAHIMDEG